MFLCADAVFVANETKMEAVPVNGGGAAEGKLAPCRICGRTFLPAVRLKHEPICQKSTNKRRKTFDSSRQRAEGTDIPTIKPLKSRPEPPKKPSNWRIKHENFIATIRAAKKISQTMKEGGALPPPPPPLYDPDYVQCPYCQRRFNENAADRHISFCKEQAARIAKSKPAGIKGKQSTTTQYKSPVLKKTNSPVSTPGASTRIPQPSVGGKSVAGFSTTKSNLSTTYENKLRDGSPAKRSSSGVGNVSGALIQPTGGLSGNIRSRTQTPPSGTRNVAAGISVNKKTYNAENYIRNNVKSGLDTRDNSLAFNDGITKGSVRSSTGQQLPRFCHECGTKYPVELAKFCCECGVRRMTV
ncbi:zinc finger C2HC domain-containing protein 1A isoform X1 [Carcharodon carcharias]|uniref:zinc finger C2HC domain-containing protein 1A isoform X1 n=1 Tax=Carcharodon carcharias TaxID=13397 RepID=UPI001B7E8EEF|nr:zinc finger C2HC domain-containing protein 1A isoform X1 [Carcharodon carcharias]